MKLATLKKLVAKGEGPELEFKRSTGSSRRRMSPSNARASMKAAR